MSQNLPGAASPEAPRIRRLNKLPLFIALAIVAVFIGAVVWGISTRGIFAGKPKAVAATGSPANSFAEKIKQGAPDGVVEAPRAELPTPAPPKAGDNQEVKTTNFFGLPASIGTGQKPALEDEATWRARMKRDQDEQEMRRLHQQRMAKMEANDKAFDSPIIVSVPAEKAAGTTGSQSPGTGASTNRSPLGDLYAASLNGQQGDANFQRGKEDFLNGQQITKAGYLANKVVPQQSLFELKRGSVIAATLISGINSDLPGRITAQVSQHVYDSATGHQLLIPQGAKLFGRYDSKISFGQSRVLVIWTDLVFPNGSTLQIGGMPGMDAEGFGGFTDQVDRKYLETFGSAALIAVIGAGMDMSLPQQSSNASSVGSTQSASDAARRSFVETFGQMAQQTVSKNLNVQPTLTIRPGYVFNVMVEQDIIFPAAYR